jgi:catechol 2,3-dioxygenase-like lactoylglutathione lyase family enzyme
MTPFWVLMSGMAETGMIQHVAVESINEEYAERFFSSVLGLSKVKRSVLSAELSLVIFQINREVVFYLYENGPTRFEVFVTGMSCMKSFVHVCIAIDNKSAFVRRCQDHGLEPFFVEKNGKELLFVRDFSGNLFEVFEKNTT